MDTPLSLDELKRLYAANQKSMSDYHERLAEDALNKMSSFDKQRLGVQRIRLYEFLNLMEEIFGDKLPILIPTAVDVEKGTRIPTVKWTTITQNIQGEALIEWMQKLEQAVCGGGAVQVRLGSHSYNLCVLDVDHDDLVQPLLQANPILNTTLQTRGSKGRHFWFFTEGDYPTKKKRILCDGKVIEFKTEGGLCTIWGTHYITGQQYQMVKKATPITFNLDDLQLPTGFVWEVKPSNNEHRKTFTGGFRANGSATSTDGTIDWNSYDAARETEPEIVEFLVGEYFDANKQETFDGTYSWRCGNICGDPAHDGKPGSFEIDSIGRCTEWATDEHFSIMQAITSEEREERHTYRDAFTFLAQQGYNFFMSKPSVTFPNMDERPRIVCYDEDFTCEGRDYPAGVYKHDILKGEGKDDPDIPLNIRIASPIKAAAITSTKEQEEHSLLLDFIPVTGKEWKKILLSKASLVATKSDEARSKLADVGVDFLSGNWNDLHQYLERQKPETVLTEAKLTGWFNGDFKTFILPHQTLGDTSKTYFNVGLRSVEYGISGTLEEWKENVAKLAKGNKWLVFSLSVALVGPLLEPLNLMGFGFHLYGDSSMGKTTLLREATSVWGSPQYLKSWRTTSNGLEVTCANRSGTLLVLDEADEATAETISASAYMISNGRGKTRMTKTITERETFNWRLCTLSSGERTLEAQIESGHDKYNVGQEMRMVPLDPTKGKHGAFDELHGHNSPAEFAQHLSSKCAQFYGSAGVQFVEQLISRGTEGLAARLNKENIATIKDCNPSAQELRVAKNLAAVALAGELAIEYGVLPFGAGTAREAVKGVFLTWYTPKTGAAKNKEHTQIINAIRDYIDTYSTSRFAPVAAVTGGMERLSQPKVINQLSGYWEDKDGKRIFLFTSSGLKSACTQKDIKRVIQALDEQQAFVEKGEDGRVAKLRKVHGNPKKLYHVSYEALG
jgi:uncharacterized protein (DUF927 family)